MFEEERDNMSIYYSYCSWTTVHSYQYKGYVDTYHLHYLSSGNLDLILVNCYGSIVKKGIVTYTNYEHTCPLSFPVRE